MFQLLKALKNKLSGEALTDGAELALKADLRGAARADPGPESVIRACTAWLCAAQDNSTSADGGVAREFSLLKGWSASCPASTGIIIPTIIAMARRSGDEMLHPRARGMLDWCVAIQLREGGFQDGLTGAAPRVPATFSTGQVLIGLAAGVAAYGDQAYIDALHRAASWLRDTQDADGCWRKHPSPLAQPGDKVYETHAAWGLFEAERYAPGHGYGAAGLRQVEWALTRQRLNGWFDSNCMDDAVHPLTLSIGYALRGLLEAHRYADHASLLAAAMRTGDSVAQMIAADGSLPARLDQRFHAAAGYVCLTGSVQLAHCLFMLYQLTGKQHYLDAGRRANGFVRRTVQVDGDSDAMGGVKGSFPVNGGYAPWQYLSRAAKFCIDANLLETGLMTRQPT